MSLNHFDAKGRAVMVDVSGKEPTLRTAVAEAQIVMQPGTLAAILEGRTTKGDVFGVARLAGIAAAKWTPDLIPLSHLIAVHHAAIEFFTDPASGVVGVVGTVRAFERTGVEMEAMTATSVAALTIYDMCKGTDRSISVRNISLLSKEGGKSGPYRKADAGKSRAEKPLGGKGDRPMPRVEDPDRT